MPIETATALGMIVGECLTTAYLSTIGMSSAPMSMKLARGADGAATLECGVDRINPSHDAARFDEPLVRACVDERGKLTEAPVVETTSGSSALDNAAVRVAKDGRYAKSVKGDVAVPNCHRFRVTFTLH